MQMITPALNLPLMPVDNKQRLAFTSAVPCARVIPVPILSDNYAYLLVDDKTKKTACIDPAEPTKLLDAAKKEGLQISTVSLSSPLPSGLALDNDAITLPVTASLHTQTLGS